MTRRPREVTRYRRLPGTFASRPWPRNFAMRREVRAQRRWASLKGRGRGREQVSLEVAVTEASDRLFTGHDGAEHVAVIGGHGLSLP